MTSPKFAVDNFAVFGSQKSGKYVEYGWFAAAADARYGAATAGIDA